MKVFIMWLTVRQLMERWNAPIKTIEHAIKAGLPYYFDDFGEPQNDLEYFSSNWIYDYNVKDPHEPAMFYFRIDETEQFENIHGIETDKLTSQERRHYGQLMAERDTFIDAISASMKIQRYCQKRTVPIIKADYLEFINEQYSHLPKTTKDEIWRALPRRYKKGPGAPIKTAKK